MNMVKLTINGKVWEYPDGITYKEVVQDFEKEADSPVIAVVAGGKIRELYKKATRDCDVKLVTTRSTIGNNT